VVVGQLDAGLAAERIAPRDRRRRGVDIDRRQRPGDPGMPGHGRHAGIAGPLAPVYVDAAATPIPGGYPLGGETRIELPNDHLQYAITWFLLALALVVIYLVFHHQHGRLVLPRRAP